jgi:hypothetical protein
MAVPNPAPGVTPPPQIPGAGSADDTVNAFANSSPVQATGSKPTTAFSNFGPLSNPSWRYSQGLGEPSNGPVVTKTVADYSKEYYNWNDYQRQQFRSKLALIDKNALVAPDSQIAQTWGDYVQQSANYFAAGATVSPWDILAKDISSRGSGSLAGTKTQTTKDVQLTSAPDANAIFHTAAQALLGRKATADEEANFKSILNQQEQSNPTNATVTTTTDEQGNTTNTSRTSSGGFSAAAAQQLAQQQAQQSGDYAKYQASTQYFTAMMQELQRGY